MAVALGILATGCSSGFAVLYNPVLPIVIGNKGIWEILNVATVVLLWSVSTLSLGQKSGLNRR